LDALVKRTGKFIVFTEDNNVARLHKVKVGLKGHNSAIILQGIKSGDRVVIQGNVGLRDGSPIRSIGTVKTGVE